MRASVKTIPNFESHEKLFKRISMSGDCWVWNGSRTNGGYGYLTIHSNKYLAHRVSFSIFNGDLDNSLVIDHTCKNRACINPDHLRQVTIKENTLFNSLALTAGNSLKESCKNGHPFTPKNTYPIPSGGRACRICRSFYSEKYKEKKRGINE